MEAPLVRPVRRRNSPELGPFALMVSNVQDLADIRRSWAPAERLAQRGLFNSQLFFGSDMAAPPSAAGPIIGAPYAVMMLETLVAWGVRHLLYLGWCGALSDALNVGDVVLPTGAIIDEGTSPAYGLNSGQTARPYRAWQDVFPPAVEALDLPLHRGPVWSTDAVFRETPSRVAHFTARGALAVEMEVSALYTAAQFLHVRLAAVLVVSDSLASGRWQPGFAAPGFIRTRQRLCRWIGGLLQDPPVAE